MTPLTRRRIFLIGLVLMTGCATNSEGWLEHRTHDELPARFVEVSASELPAICGAYPGKLLHGCAQRDYLQRTCWIYTAPNPPDWLVAHEVRHCRGWDHQ